MAYLSRQYLIKRNILCLCRMLYFACCTRMQAASYSKGNRKYFLSEFFWAVRLKNRPFSFPWCLVLPEWVILTWLTEPVKDWHPAKHTLYFTCCIWRGKDKHNRPVVCHLEGYNYPEEGGDLGKEFTAVLLSYIRTVWSQLLRVHP